MRALMGGAFLPSFLGLAATRVWLQVNLFASYTQSDDGLFTVVNNLAYCASRSRRATARRWRGSASPS